MNSVPAMRVAPVSKVPIWYWAVSLFGLAWNVYGIYQFLGSLSQTEENLMTAGMPAEAAKIYFSLPTWMSIVFAIGVFGGLLGCLLMLLRRAWALPVFAVSLAGYIALFAGDYGYGVFDSNQAQYVILLFVVAVSATLLAAAGVARRCAIIT